MLNFPNVKMELLLFISDVYTGTAHLTFNLGECVP